MLHKMNIIIKDYTSPLKAYFCDLCGKNYLLDPEEDKLECAPCTKKRNEKLLKESENRTRSRQEYELESYIKNLIGSEHTIYNNTRSVLPLRRELDLYIPSLKIAIEYNGYWFHRFKCSIPEFDNNEKCKPKEKCYHYDKFVNCKEIGIKLISIWDYDWDIDFLSKRFPNIKTKRKSLEKYLKYIFNHDVEQYEEEYIQALEDIDVHYNDLSYDHTDILLKAGFETDDVIHLESKTVNDGVKDITIYGPGYTKFTR